MGQTYSHRGVGKLELQLIVIVSFLLWVLEEEQALLAAEPSLQLNLFIFFRVPLCNPS